jgi:hypothetical protein
LLKSGYLFHGKNVYKINELAKFEPPKNTLNFLFVGSSRIDCGISPEDFAIPFKKHGISLTVTNLGIDGNNALVGLVLAKENLRKYNFIVLEASAGNPLQNNGVYLKKYFILKDLYSLILYWSGRSVMYYINCHENGYLEAKNGHNKQAVLKAKQQNLEFSNSLIKTKQSHSFEYDQYCKNIKFLLKGSKSKLIFIIMPVGGKIKESLFLNFRFEDPFALLKKCFPEAIYLSALSDSALNHFQTFEDSHLDLEAAKIFSNALGEQVEKETLRLK